MHACFTMWQGCTSWPLEAEQGVLEKVHFFILALLTRFGIITKCLGEVKINLSYMHTKLSFLISVKNSYPRCPLLVSLLFEVEVDKKIQQEVCQEFQDQLFASRLHRCSLSNMYNNV